MSEKAWDYSQTLIPISIGGMPTVNEVVFIHPETASLIATDFVFNLVDSRGIGAWIILNLFGTYQKFGVSTFFLRAVTDRSAFVKSLQKIFSHEFDQIVMSHGQVIESGGKTLLRKALADRGFSDV